MSRSLSTRAIAAVAVLLAILIGGVVLASAVRPALADRRRPPRPVLPITEAVERTFDEGVARLQLDLVRSDGSNVAVRGIVSLQRADADLTATIPGRDASRAHLRIVGDDAWVRTSADGDWIPLPAEALATADAVSWRTFLRRLGRNADVTLDERGRIRRVKAELERSTFDLRLDGYDENLPTPVPP